MESHEEDYDDGEKDDQGNVAVKFFILLCFGLIIIVVLGMLIGFIIRSLGFYQFTFDITPYVTFIIGVVFGFIIRDLSLRRSKN
jgi:NhaP-type Na+/H+ or K+/H+ antiporter